MYHFLFNKCFKTTRKSAHSGHPDSDSFHLWRLRKAAHVSLAISRASGSDSSGESSMKLSSSSSASSSY